MVFIIHDAQLVKFCQNKEAGVKGVTAAVSHEQSRKSKFCAVSYGLTHGPLVSKQ